MFDKDTIIAAHFCADHRCSSCGTDCPYSGGSLEPCVYKFAKAILTEVERDKSCQSKPEQDSAEHTEPVQPKPEQNSVERTDPIQPSSVDHPSHYQGEYECIDLMREIYGDDAVRNFCIINAYKYRFRAGKKQGETAQSDLDKADWYERYVMKNLWKNGNLFWDIYKRELRDRLDENK